MSINARLFIIGKRLNSVKRVIAVVSGKGGSGKDPSIFSYCLDYETNI
jgi:Mrp family chromosome partitioning ATPase